MPPFLSDAWMDEAKKIREEVGDSDTPPAHKVRMNMVIIECPDGVGADGTVHTHMDTSSGEIEMDLGHLEGPDLTITADYDDRQGDLRRPEPPGRDAGLHVRQGQGAGRHDQADGHAAGRPRPEGRRDR